MLRRFTQDVGKNFKEGQCKDFPRHTWMKIAQDFAKLEGRKGFLRLGNRQIEKILNKFSDAIETNMALQSMLRGPVRLRSRLGSESRSSV